MFVSQAQTVSRLVWHTAGISDSDLKLSDYLNLTYFKNIDMMLFTSNFLV